MCGEYCLQVHLVMLLDSSPSMAGKPWDQLLKAYDWVRAQLAGSQNVAATTASVVLVSEGSAYVPALGCTVQSRLLGCLSRRSSCFGIISLVVQELRAPSPSADSCATYKPPKPPRLGDQAATVQSRLLGYLS